MIEGRKIKRARARVCALAGRSSTHARAGFTFLAVGQKPSEPCRVRPRARERIRRNSLDRLCDVAGTARCRSDSAPMDPVREIVPGARRPSSHARRQGLRGPRAIARAHAHAYAERLVAIAQPHSTLRFYFSISAISISFACFFLFFFGLHSGNRTPKYMIMHARPAEMIVRITGIFDCTVN